MENEILQILKGSDKALSVYELEEQLNINDADGLKELLKVLNKLEDELKLYRTNKNNYMLFNNSHLKIGTFLGNKKSFGFVDIDGEEDVFIPPNNINGALHKDKVIVEITSKNGLRLEGRILKIINRSFKLLVGEFYYKNGKGYINLDDEKVKLNIIIDEKNSMGAMNGHKVLVKVTNHIKGYDYKGEVVKILGHKNDPGVDILSIVNQLGIPDEFSEEVMHEVENIASSVSPIELKDRRDLRDKVIFTIDGDDTKDIDDAISIEKLDNGNYILGVHIADVSYYVKSGSKIDEEAYNRGTSVYLADRVIPMLPHKLSNGICSLNPNVDRLSVTCQMEINEKGEVIDYDIFPSVIKSRIQMTYKCVNSILEDNVIPDGYQDYVDDLKEMANLASILRKHKIDRGYIDFEIDESKIIVDDKGKAIDIKLRERGTGEKLIEDFMIAANETVASCIYFMELPFVYRVHGEPSEEKIQEFLKFVSILGYKIDGKIKDVSPKTMQDILNQLKEKKEFHMLSNLLLRSMQKAIYDEVNIGHYGLASKCYTHFTSPIRRYPDTTVHRLIRTYLFDKKIDNDTINFYEHKLPILTSDCSDCERRAIECEREVEDMKKAEYMMDHIGEEFNGMISGVMSFGIFVELPNLIEGLIKIDDLTDDHYVFDETTFTLKGTKNKRGYRLGDSLKVKVKAANKETRTVDFVIADSKE